MTCDICNGHEATVHLTQVVDGDVKKLHMCEDCARKSGINIENPVSISELLLGLGKAESGADDPASPEPGRACPSCHMRHGDFRKTGRLGCPDCYTAFASELAPLLRQMQKKIQHTGRAPRAGPHAPSPAIELESLREALDRAVIDERFEDAARLRDRMAELRLGLAASVKPDAVESGP